MGQNVVKGVEDIGKKALHVVVDAGDKLHIVDAAHKLASGVTDIAKGAAHEAEAISNYVAHPEKAVAAVSRLVHDPSKLLHGVENIAKGVGYATDALAFVPGMAPMALAANWAANSVGAGAHAIDDIAHGHFSGLANDALSTIPGASKFKQIAGVATKLASMAGAEGGYDDDNYMEGGAQGGYGDDDDNYMTGGAQGKFRNNPVLGRWTVNHGGDHHRFVHEFQRRNPRKPLTFYLFSADRARHPNARETTRLVNAYHVTPNGEVHSYLGGK
jgi:hypothetical protein